MKISLPKKFTASIILAGVILSLFALPITAGVVHAQQSVIDASSSGRRSIDEAINSLQPRCSIIASLFKLQLNCVILNIIWVFDKFVSSTLLAAATYIFDISIDYSVSDFVSDINGKGALVNIGWGIVRDITNLFFIFVLLWIALATIFSIQGYGAKELLGQLIIAALLVNFSLAIGGFFINFSNALGKTFIKALEAKTCILPGTNLQCGISDRLLKFAHVQKTTALKLSSTDREAACERGNTCDPEMDPGCKITQRKIEQCKSGLGVAETILEKENENAAILDAIYTALWLLIVLPVLAFVFFAGAIFFLIRYLMLSILLIFAPIVFLLSILPATRQLLWGDWWNNLIKWSFFAPAFLFLLFLTIETFGQLTTRGGMPKGFFSIGFDMILLIAMMVMNLLVAQKMGIALSGTVIGWGARAAGWTGRQVRGAISRGAIRAMAPAAEQFAKTPVGQFLARTPILRALTQPAVTIQAERERLNKERAARVLGAIRTAPPEFGAARLGGEAQNVQEAVYKAAAADDIERIMKGLTREMKDADGNVIRDRLGNPLVNRAGAEKEIIKIRNRDPRLAEKIENSVKDIHLKVVANKGIGLGTPVQEAQLTPEDQTRYKKFQEATTSYLHDQSEQKLKNVLTAENIKNEHVADYIIKNFSEREGKALSRTTDQLRALTETLIKMAEKQRPADFTARKDYYRTWGVSEDRARFFAFRDLAPQTVQSPSLQRWLSAAPTINMMYKGAPLRERRYEAGGGTTPAPPPTAP